MSDLKQKRCIACNAHTSRLSMEEAEALMQQAPGFEGA